MVSAEIQKRFGAKHVRKEGFGLPRPVGWCIALLLWPVIYFGAALLIAAAALQTAVEAVADAARPARRAARAARAAAGVAATGAYVLHNVDQVGERVWGVCGSGGMCGRVCGRRGWTQRHLPRSAVGLSGEARVALPTLQPTHPHPLISARTASEARTAFAAPSS